MKFSSAFLLVGALIALGMLSHQWGFRLGGMGDSPAKVSIKWRLPAAGPDGRGLDDKDMTRTRAALDSQARHLRSAEVMVDRNPLRSRDTMDGSLRKAARYRMRLELANGILLESRERLVDWDHLDASMARTVKETFVAYRKMREQHDLDGSVREIKNF